MVYRVRVKDRVRHKLGNPAGLGTVIRIVPIVGEASIYVQWDGVPGVFRYRMDELEVMPL